MAPSNCPAAEQSDDARKSCASQQTATAHSALQPSVATVQSLQSPGEQLIVSSGHGDLTLLNSGNPQGDLTCKHVTTIINALPSECSCSRCLQVVQAHASLFSHQSHPLVQGVYTLRLPFNKHQVIDLAASFVHPVRPSPVSVFVSPRVIRKCYMLPAKLPKETCMQTMHAGHVQVVAWAVKQKQGHASAGCEIFLISLEHDKTASGAPLTVKAVELLQVCIGESCELASVSIPNGISCASIAADPCMF